MITIDTPTHPTMNFLIGKFHSLLLPHPSSFSCSCQTPYAKCGVFLSSISLSLQSQTWVSHSNRVLFVGMDSEAVNVSSNRRMQTHINARTHKAPKGFFPLIQVLLNLRQCSRCEAAVRCVCTRASVCIYVSSAIWPLVTNYTPNPPHAPTRTNTLAFTVSPKQLQNLENTGEHITKGKSQQLLGWYSTNHVA